MRQRILIALVSAVVLGGSPPTSLAVAPADNAVLVRDFKDALVRPLDGTQLAAIAAPGAQRDVLRARLNGIGIDAQLREFGHGDIVLVDVPVQRGGEALRDTIATVAAQLADDAAANPASRGAFVSPIMLDQYDGPMIVLPSIFARFAKHIDDRTATAIVEALGVGTIVEFDRQPGVHRIVPDTTSGLVAVELANALAMHTRPTVQASRATPREATHPSTAPRRHRRSSQASPLWSSRRSRR